MIVPGGCGGFEPNETTRVVANLLPLVNILTLKISAFLGIAVRGRMIDCLLHTRETTVATRHNGNCCVLVLRLYYR